MSHFLNFTLSPPLCYSLKWQTMEWKKRRFFVYIAFLDTYVCINNPYWESSGIIITLCKYEIVISDTLIGCWICFSFCWLWYHQSFMKIQEERIGFQEERIGLQKKVHRRICVSDITFLTARSSSYVNFCCIFRLLLPFRLLQFYVENIFLPSVYGPVHVRHLKRR